MYRRQIEIILKDLEKKIVFLVGPRQVGKTWLAKQVSTHFANTIYLNYDSSTDRKVIKQTSWFEGTELLIFDELHKMPGWKNYLKGVFDTKPEAMKILVTGSARMDTFRQAGDSLAGRYFIHHLLPFSLAELKASTEDIEHYIQRGGFPEPWLADDDITAQRWRKQYVDGLIRQDVLDFKQIESLRAMQMIFELLRHRVGSVISFASLARDVAVSTSTVLKYIKILEALYIIFRVTPYTKNIARSVLKEPKIYFYDNGLVLGDTGAQFENFVALSLLKHVTGRNDYLGENNALHYLRTKDGREVDFCLTSDHTVTTLLEAKCSDQQVSSNLKYFCQKYLLPGVQVVKELRHEQTLHGIDIRRADKYLTQLYL